MIDVDMFTDEQKRFLSALVSDFGGPTSTGNVLRVLEATLHEVCLLYTSDAADEHRDV